MINRYEVVYSSKALEDLRNLYRYIALKLKVPGTAKRKNERLRKAVRSLEYLPARHAVYDAEPWKSMGMHKLSVDNHVIFYLIDEVNFVVSIIRIVYSGTNVDDLQI